MQVSCLKDKPNIRAVATGDTPEVVGRHRTECQCTVNVKHCDMLSCPPPSNFLSFFFSFFLGFRRPNLIRVTGLSGWRTPN